MSRHYNDMSHLGPDAPNVDRATGIRVGWLSIHSVLPEALDDIITKGDDLTYEAAVDEAKARIATALTPVLKDLGVISDYMNRGEEREADWRLTEAQDAVWNEVEQYFNDRYESDGSSYRLEEDGYVIEYDTSSALACVAVVKSPFYTFAAFGSPCIPNAGDLDTPRAEDEGGIKTYCLGPEWFDGETAPYPVYKVETGELVR